MDESIPGKLDALHGHVAGLTGRVEDLERAMERNNEMTEKITTIIPVVQDIRDAQIAGKVAGKLIKGAGGIAIGATAIGTAIAAAWHWASGR